ncbi:hypothetical protein TPHA_0C02120 [Tetrapisispora phaffii CBS 4417]|uniref:Uncharacterized protein n=1 Tax=Tetrapisispora phaffii (strain ATCC 24235 / CBS 4417 / NBRC 1672 / NRRL Y-8282 / UCD 70-5) TaxID=1071381 RepID=G8BRJ1_TETPH|nr:hypothetical protein TPHA_0C02120 [Tetrapisispora phaffii CBS 4417]CCE62367.1 hypothetical protein TPHA_0C02120 [Tetrapisispora phaffii CBS 4417]
MPEVNNLSKENVVESSIIGSKLADEDLKLNTQSNSGDKIVNNSKPKPTEINPIEKISQEPTTNASTGQATVSSSNFNTRILWPDLIKIPTNKWVYECKEIIDKLGHVNSVIEETKRNLEKCLLYFYTLKKRLDLFDHTYTASCILFFRYWFVYGIPNSMLDCVHIAQAILVTACKSSENNRPIDAYVKATCDFISREIQGNKIVNIDKMKWDIRDKIVENEKKILCMFGFDLNVENPKEILEEMFSGYYRYNRDYNLPEDFQKIFPKLLQEARNFIVQSITQPVCLLFNGQKFIQLALIFTGIQYKKIADSKFKYPKNFFKNKFASTIKPEEMEDLFTDFRILEESFFSLKSNKGDKLFITKQEISDLIEEDEVADDKIIDPYNYDSMKSGEVRQELLDNIETRLQDMFTKMKKDYQNKRASSGTLEGTPNKKQSYKIMMHRKL